ncbi:hypothetical protein D9758_005479 [Tetrapyrgos nigripes]|uniref:Uncharacterized protein n=1 Tax=Tetrapyrgos nigripes TaxID=182062 RepID=A0A8H5GI92_9AGAR|nr:hypothetical protein D9758_005479 [Tetrapyrgos nigripes]
MPRVAWASATLDVTENLFSPISIVRVSKKIINPRPLQLINFRKAEFVQLLAKFRPVDRLIG